MDLESTITFCQNDLPRTAFSVFEDMRKSGELCDLEIKVKNSTITAHRVVLAAAIPYFRSVFANTSLEIEKKETGMEKVDSGAIESLIDFAYTSKVDISLENVESLLAASEFLQMSGVKDACVEFLSKRLYVSNVLQVRTLAHCINIQELTDCCDRYFLENFEEFSKSRDFLNLSPSCFAEIISKDELHVSREEIVFEAVMNYVKASPSERRGFLPELLREVRLIFVPTDYLMKTVAPEEIIRDSPDCRDLIENVMSFHLLPKEEALLLNLKSQPRTINIFPKGIYAICSEDMIQCIHARDLTKGAWEKLKSKEGESMLQCVVATSDAIYLFFNTTVEKIDLRTLQWLKLEPTHNNIGDAAGVSHENVIYFFGLWTKVLCFATREAKWLKEKYLKFGRCRLAVAALQEFVYITGGFSSESADVTRVVEKYDPVSGQSRQVSAMLTPRMGHGCTSMKGKIYVCGGCKPFMDIFDSAEVYDPVTDQWNYFSSMKIKKSYFSLLSHNGKIYSLGGESSLPFTNSEIYDPETDEWKLSFSIPKGFRHAVTASIFRN